MSNYITQKNSRHYVDNKEFLSIMKTYREKLEKSKLEGTPKPVPPDSVGEIILQICSRLMTRYNFQNYTWKDEMENAAVFDCVSSIEKFDPNKSDNPFGYFTQIAYRAAVRVIVEEKKQNKLKNDMMKNIQHFFALEGYDENEEFNHINANDALEYMQ